MLITALTTIGLVTGCSDQSVTDTQEVTVRLEWDDSTKTWNGKVKFEESRTNGFENKIDVEVTNVAGDDDATTNAIKQALGLE